MMDPTLMMMPGEAARPRYYDDFYDSEDDDYDSELSSDENYDVLNDGPEQPRGPWVKDPI